MKKERVKKKKQRKEGTKERDREGKKTKVGKKEVTDVEREGVWGAETNECCQWIS